MSSRRRKKSVTWSPVVTSVCRPTAKRSQKKRQHSSRFKFSGGDNHEHKVTGHLQAYARRSTRSLLLTIRNNVHRDMQMLIDMQAQQIRRIYDGMHSYTVNNEQGSPLRLDCKLGTIRWTDDEMVRKSSARGFRLDWLEGTHFLMVESRPSTRKRRRFTKKKKL